MGLTWLTKNFICKDLYAPFIIEKDIDYVKDLRKKYLMVLNQAINAGADEKSIEIIRTVSSDILKSVNYYYKADLIKSYETIVRIIKDIGNEHLAVDTLLNSEAFPGDKGKELQLFRCRVGNPSSSYTAKEMLHLPRRLRAKTGNYRFSIPGNPSLYLSNSSYGCWIETGFPADINFNVAPVLLDGKQKILNLAISIRDFRCLNEFEEKRVHCWLKLYLLALATSYKIKEEGRIFKSEYIVSQSIMIASKTLGYDGVAYYSKRVSDEVFSLCAINLALFVKYKGEYSNIIKHMIMDDAFNYSVYKQLLPTLRCKEYELRSTKTGYITNIGSYDRQYPYRETEFYDFDQFLFYTWRDKQNGKGKDQVSWGIDVT